MPYTIRLAIALLYSIDPIGYYRIEYIRYQHMSHS